MAWQPKGNIRGPQGVAGTAGATGAQGPAGQNGERWFTGTAVPTTVSGAVVGDWYLLSTTGDFYECTGTNQWTLRGNLKGATGATGSQGPQGNTGAQGVQGPAGAAGADGAGVPAGGAIGAILRKKSAVNNDTEWKPLASLQAAGGTTSTSSTTNVMGGHGAAGAVITPTASGKIHVTMSGTMFSATTAGTATAGIRYGTGTPPAAGAAATGTAVGQSAQKGPMPAANTVIPFSLSAVITGLAVGTPVWLDITMSSSSGLSSFVAAFAAFEFP